jgi:hypothetical protein
LGRLARQVDLRWRGQPVAQSAVTATYDARVAAELTQWAAPQPYSAAPALSDVAADMGLWEALVATRARARTHRRRGGPGGKELSLDMLVRLSRHLLAFSHCEGLPRTAAALEAGLARLEGEAPCARMSAATAAAPAASASCLAAPSAAAGAAAEPRTALGAALSLTDQALVM